MSKIIKTQIDGIDVELELTNIGDDIVTDVISGQDKPAPQIKIVKVGNGEGASSEDTKKVEDKVNGNSAELVANIIEAISQLPASGKPWYQSKTLWVNIIAIVSAIAAYFGFQLSFLTPELMMVLVSVIIGLINIYLRTKSKDPIKPINPINTPAIVK